MCALYMGSCECVISVCSRQLTNRGLILSRDNFILSKVSRLALEPTFSPRHRVRGALSLGVKWWEHEFDHSPPSNAEVKNE
jgi:hypothetical protein